MNNTVRIVVLAISFLLLIFRISRCSKREAALQKTHARDAYYEACQKKLDTAWLYFKPVADALENNQTVSEEILSKSTTQLYDLARDAENITDNEDEGNYHKKYVAGFIEHERGLTCCYLKKYQEEILKNKKIQKGTSANLLGWLDRFASYNSVYGNIRFSLHNQSNFSAFRDAVIAASPQ